MGVCVGVYLPNCIYVVVVCVSTTCHVNVNCVHSSKTKHENCCNSKNDTINKASQTRAHLITLWIFLGFSNDPVLGRKHNTGGAAEAWESDGECDSLITVRVAHQCPQRVRHGFSYLVF